MIRVTIEAEDGTLIPFNQPIRVDTKGKKPGAILMCGDAVVGTYRNDGEAKAALRKIRDRIGVGRYLVLAEHYSPGSEILNKKQ